MMSYGQRIITKPREINTETPTVKTTTSTHRVVAVKKKNSGVE